MVPRFLYFDLGNVLLNFDHRIACDQMAAVTGLTSERVWQVVFAGNLEWEYERGAITSRQFYEQFCALTQTAPDYDALHFAASAIFELNVPIVPIIVHLQAAGYRLGILSNTCEAHWLYAQRYTILRTCFHVFALSYELRSMKPDPHIYAEAARMAGVEPSEIFYVDDREENVHGACAAGYDATIFTTPQRLAADLRSRGVSTSY